MEADCIEWSCLEEEAGLMHHVMSQLRRRQEERRARAGQKWKLPPCGQPISLFTGATSDTKNVINPDDESNFFTETYDISRS